jgi:hypothetical protein
MMHEVHFSKSSEQIAVPTFQWYWVLFEVLSKVFG